MKQVVGSPQMLGQFIQRVRKYKKLTQSNVGKGFKIDQTTLSSIENGAKGTRIETLFRVLAALDLEVIVQDKQKGSQSEDRW